MTTDTPLTDAATFEIISSLQSGTENVVRADFASDLERKLSQATALLTSADDLLFSANTLLAGWPQALRWCREYARSKKLKP